MSASTSSTAVYLRVGTDTYGIAAPEPIAKSMRAVFARHLISPGEAIPRASIDFEQRLNGLSVADAARAVTKFLGAARRLSRDARRESGVVVAFDGEAALLRGAKGDDLFPLVAQLTTRGWGLVATTEPVIDLDGRVSGIQQLLTTRAAAIAEVPAVYRGAIERSPWRSTHDDIEFYAIDPATTIGRGVWSDSAQHRATVRLADLGSGDSVTLADRFEEWWCWVGRPDQGRLG